MHFIHTLGEEVPEGVDAKMLSASVASSALTRVSSCFLFFVYDMMLILFRIVSMYCFVIKFIAFSSVTKGIFFRKFSYLTT